MDYSDLPLLIETPNCTKECSSHHCCNLCRDGNADAFLWYEGEREERFTAEERAEIEALKDEKGSYLEEGVGCRLPRKWRPAECLRYSCDKITVVNHFKEVKDA